MQRAIGFFDSGVGGISVLKAARLLLPHEDMVFYGDNRNAPYGTRPLNEIRELTEAAVQVLLKNDIKALVIACNTATSAYATELRGRLSIPVIAMEPALKPAQSMRRGGQVIVLATKATLELEKFQHLMEKYGEGAVPVVGEKLADIVENGAADSTEAVEQIERILAPHLKGQIDAIVLGCTHYIFLKKAIAKVCPGIPMVDGNEGTVRQLKRVLAQKGLLRAQGQGGVSLQSSGGEHFVELMNTLLNGDNE